MRRLSFLIATVALLIPLALHAEDAPAKPATKQEIAAKEAANQAEIQRLTGEIEQTVISIEKALRANDSKQAGTSYMAASNLFGQLNLIGSDYHSDPRLAKVFTRFAHLSMPVVNQMNEASKK